MTNSHISCDWILYIASLEKETSVQMRECEVRSLWSWIYHQVSHVMMGSCHITQMHRGDLVLLREYQYIPRFYVVTVQWVQPNRRDMHTCVQSIGRNETQVMKAATPIARSSNNLFWYIFFWLSTFSTLNAILQRPLSLKIDVLLRRSWQ